mmetsp:Transcript_25277/g.83540  ORF Transcript_25277/g.83540 Transcript_25277/m.83540 type:complete len:145 (-) Transcript_25277:214-648(-)
MTNKTSTASAKLSRKSSDVEISKFSLEEAGSDEELPQQETGLQEVVVFCHSSKLSAHAKLELHCSSSATVSDLISELILKFRDHNEEIVFMSEHCATTNFLVLSSSERQQGTPINTASNMILPLNHVSWCGGVDKWVDIPVSSK